jgi:CIC family chloride channel protein
MFAGAVTHAPLMATLMTVELTGQWMLLPLVLLCNTTAWAVARSISPDSLYALATPKPADKLLESDVRATKVRQKAISQGPTPAMEGRRCWGIQYLRTGEHARTNYI